MNVVIYFNDIHGKHNPYTNAFILNEGKISASIQEPKCYVTFSEWIEEELIPHERMNDDEVQDQYDNVYEDYYNVHYTLSIRDYLKYLKNHI